MVMSVMVVVTLVVTLLQSPTLGVKSSLGRDELVLGMIKYIDYSALPHFPV